MRKFLNCLGECFRFSVFRSRSLPAFEDKRLVLTVGIGLTWLVGIGRWWEDPKASLLQHTGLGSVLYTAILALFIWGVAYPLMGRKHAFWQVWVMVMFCATPGFLYALPVRHGLPLPLGQDFRLAALAVVSLWRISLLYFYLGAWLSLKDLDKLLVWLIPLQSILAAISFLNLEKVVIVFMGRLEDVDRSVNDTAYEMVVFVALLAALLSPVTVLTYLIAIVQARKKKALADSSTK